jgi:isocitrate lyase
MASNGNGSKRTNGKTNGRWEGINRPYTDKDVEKLRGSMKI